MIHFLGMVIVGIIVGIMDVSIFDRLITPRPEHFGFFMTLGLGIAGSILGGLFARVFSTPDDDAPIQPIGIICSFIGAVIMLYACNHTPG